MPELHPKFVDAIKEVQAAYPEYTIGGSERHGLVCHMYRMTAESEAEIVAGEWRDKVIEAMWELRHDLNEAKAKP